MLRFRDSNSENNKDVFETFIFHYTGKSKNNTSWWIFTHALPTVLIFLAGWHKLVFIWKVELSWENFSIWLPVNKPVMHVFDSWQMWMDLSHRRQCQPFASGSEQARESRSVSTIPPYPVPQAPTQSFSLKFLFWLPSVRRKYYL